MNYDEARAVLNKSPGKHLCEINKCLDINRFDLAVLYVQNQTGCEQEIAEQIIDDIIGIGKKISNPYIKPTVECPYCHSTNTKKISGTTRFISTGLFGLASNKIGKNFHCNNCKSDF